MTEENNQNQVTEAGEIDVDALVQEAYAPKDPVQQSSAEGVKEGQAQPPVQEFEFDHNGKLVKVPFDKAKIYAQQGYNYAQRMNEFNKNKIAFETRLKEFEPLEKRFREVDSYIQKNPEWWEHVQTAWQNRGQSVQAQQQQQQQNQYDPNNPLVRQLSELQKEIGEVRQFKDEILTERQAKQRDEEDSKLTQEIESIQKKYPDIDFNAPDTDGKSLEVKVLEHAAQNGIKSFDAAFKSFYHDQLISRAEAKAKEALNKDVQKKTKLGLLGQSQAPKKALSDVQNVKTKSWDAIQKEVFDELGIA